MGKLFAGVLTAVLALSVLTASAFAAQGASYVDIGGDAVYDNNYLTGERLQKDCRRHCGGCARQCAAAGCRFVDEDGDGICDLLATGNGGCSQNYVDNNGDGVCDNFDSCPQSGTGCQNGSGCSHHQGGHHGGRGR